jgi:rhomboid protease GluP
MLAAVGIEAHLIADAGVVRLCVTSSEALRARHELGCYEHETARWRRPRFMARAALHRVEGALVYSAVLLFLFAAQRRHALSIDWLAAGAANAGRIVDGEWWRTITALALHVELGHLMGNLALACLSACS